MVADPFGLPLKQLLLQSPGGALVAKLCAYLRPKLHPVLLDAAINSPATVRLNLYQMAWLAGAKLSCLVQALCAHRPARSRWAQDAMDAI